MTSQHLRIMTRLLILAYFLIILVGEAKHFANGSRSNKCPFTSNNSPYERCHDCRLCPFRGDTCCQREHEEAIEEAVEIYGDTYWPCRLTILRYSECGKCSPDSHLFVKENIRKHFINYTEIYMPDEVMPIQFNQQYGINICKSACLSIYQQCQNALSIFERPITEELTPEEFCKDFPEWSEDIKCFNSSPKYESSCLTAMISILVTYSLYHITLIIF